MQKEQFKYFPQTKEELRNLIEQRIKVEGNKVNLNDIDVSAITDMSGLFEILKDFNGNISKWDVSKVTDMIRMFSDCPIKDEYKPKFEIIDEPHIDIR